MTAADDGSDSTQSRVDVDGLDEDALRLVNDFVELVRKWRSDRRQSPNLEFQLLWRSEVMKGEGTGRDMVVTIVLDSADVMREAPVPRIRRRRHSYGPRREDGET